MKNAWVVMTALPFTEGHEDIIQFAHVFSGHGVTTNVVFSPAEGEPHITKRLEAIEEFCESLGTGVKVHFVLNRNSEDPESVGFWSYWFGVFTGLGFRSGDLVVGGELYVEQLATVLGGESLYLPRGVETSQVSGRMVRSSPIQNFGYMARTMQEKYKKRVTIFGAESVGKTSLVKALGDLRPGGTTYPEFARPYLEQRGAELTVSKFNDIILGQKAQMALWRETTGVPVSFWDTDILSTYGYLELHPEFDTDGSLRGFIKKLAEEHGYLADKYFLLSQEPIEFEPNELRYGGNVRETDDEFWKNILNEFHAEWEYIETGNFLERRDIVLNYAYAELDELTAYKRPFND